MVHIYSNHFVQDMLRHKEHVLRLGAKMERDMRKNFDHYEKLSFSYYDKTNTGQMESKLVSILFDI